MKARIQMFAVARQLSGRDWVEVDLPVGATVADLRGALISHVPALQPLISHLVFAIDAEYASEQTVLAADVEIACIPPVSGG